MYKMTGYVIVRYGGTTYNVLLPVYRYSTREFPTNKYHSIQLVLLYYIILCYKTYLPILMYKLLFTTYYLLHVYVYYMYTTPCYNITNLTVIIPTIILLFTP